MFHETLTNYYRLSKPGIVRMVLVSATIGFMLGEHSGVMPWGILFFALLGIGMSAAGSAALNNVLERDLDARMNRTRNREIPSGRISPESALAYGLLMVLGGVLILVWKVNLLTAFVVLLTAFLYTLVYTPMKRVHWLNTSIGAIPGALPILSGWTASAGEIGLGAWILFYILYAWQHPHFYAISWMYRKDYEQAGYRMLCSIDDSGDRLFRHALTFSVFLFAVSLMPTVTGLTGRLYLAGAILLGVLMISASFRLARLRTVQAARGVLRASIVYLPVLLVLIVADGIL